MFGPATKGATGWCLEVHEIVVRKLVAGREKDLEYARAAVKHGLARVDELAERLTTMVLERRARKALAGRIEALRSAASRA